MTSSPTPSASRAVSVWNIANVLTVARLIMVPFFIAYVLSGTSRAMAVATIIFLIASWTDNLDGYLARRFNLITDFGKIADPIADKALTLSAFILLSYHGRIWWWVTIIIIIRELGITVMRLALVKRTVMPASRGGKIKTTLQMVGLVALLTPWELFLSPGAAHVMDLVGSGIIGAAFVVTVATGLDYVKSAWDLTHA